MEKVSLLFENYGYIVLFVGLLLEYVFLPFPGELVLSYAGFLSNEGQLNWILCSLLAGSGTMIGMTITFVLGKKLGSPFIEKHGSKIMLGPEKMKKTSRWFEKYGNKVLLIAYFIPGVRHFTGYLSGIMGVSYRSFALYAYSGAALWVGTFIALGYFVGPEFKHLEGYILSYLIKALCVISPLLVVWFVYKRLRPRLKQLRQARMWASLTAAASSGIVLLIVLSIK